MLALIGTWYEIWEGGAVTLAGTLVICGFTYALHRIRTAMHERHHAETMAAHRKTPTSTFGID